MENEKCGRCEDLVCGENGEPLPGWGVLVESMSQACPVCGTVPEECSFCTDPAYKWVEADVLVEGPPETRVEATVYYCEACWLAMASEKWEDGKAGPEWGTYQPDPDCKVCDPWD